MSAVSAAEQKSPLPGPYRKNRALPLFRWRLWPDQFPPETRRDFRTEQLYHNWVIGPARLQDPKAAGPEPYRLRFVTQEVGNRQIILINPTIQWIPARPDPDCSAAAPRLPTKDVIIYLANLEPPWGHPGTKLYELWCEAVCPNPKSQTDRRTKLEPALISYLLGEDQERQHLDRLEHLSWSNEAEPIGDPRPWCQVERAVRALLLPGNNGSRLPSAWRKLSYAGLGVEDAYSASRLILLETAKWFTDHHGAAWGEQHLVVTAAHDIQDLARHQRRNLAIKTLPPDEIKLAVETAQEEERPGFLWPSGEAQDPLRLQLWREKSEPQEIRSGLEGRCRFDLAGTLRALLNYPRKKEAAAVLGITPRALRNRTKLIRERVLPMYQHLRQRSLYEWWREQRGNAPWPKKSEKVPKSGTLGSGSNRILLNEETRNRRSVRPACADGGRSSKLLPPFL